MSWWGCELLKNGGWPHLCWPHLCSNDDLNEHRQAPIIYQDGIKKSLDIIYKKGDNGLKQKVEDLINILIEKGSSTYWVLKDVLK